MVANQDNMLLTFDECNMKYFEGKLLFPQFGLLHSYRTCGYFHCNYQQTTMILQRSSLWILCVTKWFITIWRILE